MTGTNNSLFPPSLKRQQFREYNWFWPLTSEPLFLGKVTKTFFSREANLWLCYKVFISAVRLKEQDCHTSILCAGLCALSLRSVVFPLFTEKGRDLPSDGFTFMAGNTKLIRVNRRVIGKPFAATLFFSLFTSFYSKVCCEMWWSSVTLTVSVLRRTQLKFSITSYLVKVTPWLTLDGESPARLML